MEQLMKGNYKRKRLLKNVDDMFTISVFTVYPFTNISCQTSPDLAGILGGLRKTELIFAKVYYMLGWVKFGMEFNGSQHNPNFCHPKPQPNNHCIFS